MQPEAPALEASAVIRAWQAGELAARVRGRAIELRAARAPAIAYKEIVELMLAAAGARGVRWLDARGEAAAGAGVLRDLARLGLDAAALPWLYLRHARAVRRALAAAGPPRWQGVLDSCLYLRLDHNFDLASGGSVAHTAGVINGFRELLPAVDVLSSDRLPLVEPDAGFHELTPRYGLGRNVPGLPLFGYSEQVIERVRAMPGPAPGFLYARSSSGNYAGPALRALLRRPWVCEYNGGVAWVARNWSGRRLRFERLFHGVEQANLVAADLIVAVSRPLLDELVARGIDAERVLVNPNGVDPELFHPELDGRGLRERHGIAPQERVVGFLGTFGPWHGAEVLAQAFVRLLASAPGGRERWRLLLVGDGQHTQAVREILHAGGAADRAVLTGAVEQSRAPAYLAACDVLASPHVPNPDGSPFFGSPTKLFEYMAVGKAIVASALDQIAEVLTDGDTALLVPPADAEALARALARAGEDAALRARLGAAARAEVLAHHTWRQHSRRILDALEARAAAAT